MGYTVIYICERRFYLNYPCLSFISFLQERNDVEVEKVKSTLILCYGHVALNAPPEKILNRIDQDILSCISKHFNTKVMWTLRCWQSGEEITMRVYWLHTNENNAFKM